MFANCLCLKVGGLLLQLWSWEVIPHFLSLSVRIRTNVGVDVDWLGLRHECGARCIDLLRGRQENIFIGVRLFESEAVLMMDFLGHYQLLMYLDSLTSVHFLLCTTRKHFLPEDGY